MISGLNPNLPRPGIDGLRISVGDAPLAGIERVDGSDLFDRQREVEHVDVLRNTRGRDGLRHDGEVVVQMPAQYDLSRRLALSAISTTVGCASDLPCGPPSGDHDWITMPLFANPARNSRWMKVG